MEPDSFPPSPNDGEGGGDGEIGALRQMFLDLGALLIGDLLERKDSRIPSCLVSENVA